MDLEYGSTLPLAPLCATLAIGLRALVLLCVLSAQAQANERSADLAQGESRANDPGAVVDGSVVANDSSRARALVEGALELSRGTSSFAELTMHVQRPDWQRTSSLVAWTRGQEDALIRFTQPAKDAGNATLKRGREMWTFTPKHNRVIRLPASLMSQSWAGSDFSYNDLARSDELLVYFELKIVDEKVEGQHRVYTIEALPHNDAPVVWGKQVMRLRDDFVMLETVYFDQQMVPIKRMDARKIGSLGGRIFALEMRMSDLTKEAHFTELSYQQAQFDLDLGDDQFTQFALRNAVSPTSSVSKTVQ